MNPQTLRFSTSDTAIPFEKRLRLFPSSRFHAFPVFSCSHIAKSPHLRRSKHGVAAIRNCKDLVSSVSRRIDPISQREVGAPRVGKTADIATLGNLCVDIVLSVPSLPPTSADEKRAYMEQLSASRPDKVIDRHTCTSSLFSCESARVSACSQFSFSSTVGSLRSDKT